MWRGDGLECRKPLGIDPSNLPRPRLLIDVRRSCLTEAEPGHRYDCLSYVWGGAPTLKAQLDNLSFLMVGGSLAIRESEIPKTIAHAIGLVEQLDIDYLWVDFLCIVQDYPESKPAMTGIYANAYVTIIAGICRASPFFFLYLWSLISSLPIFNVGSLLVISMQITSKTLNLFKKG